MTWQEDVGVKVQAFRFRDGWREEPVDSIASLRASIEDPTRLIWVDVYGEEASFVSFIVDLTAGLDVFAGIKPARAAKRGETPPKLPPKARAFSGCVFGRAYWMGLLPKGERPGLGSQEVHLLVGKTFALTFRYPCRAWDLDEVATDPTIRLRSVVDTEFGLSLDIVKEDVLDLQERRREESPEAFGLEVAGALLDQVVDSVFESLDRLRDDHADAIEGEVLGREWLRNPQRPGMGGPTLDDRMLGLRRLLRQIRWAFMPSDEVDEFMSGPFLGVSDPVIRYKFADLEREADRAVQSVRDLIEQVDQSAELSSAMRTEQLNRTMYVLTAVATVLLVPAVIAGIYGMNFHNMPELGWRLGYLGAIVAMIVLGTVMWVMIRGYLRRH
jgi:Mg2+ and Co2+ transporter CorA